MYYSSVSEADCVTASVNSNRAGVLLIYKKNLASSYVRAVDHEEIPSSITVSPDDEVPYDAGCISTSYSTGTCSYIVSHQISEDWGTISVYHDVIIAISMRMRNHCQMTWWYVLTLIFGCQKTEKKKKSKHRTFQNYFLTHAQKCTNFPFFSCDDPVTKTHFDDHNFFLYTL